MKRKKNSRASSEAIREANLPSSAGDPAVSGITAYPGMLGIEIGVPYSRRMEPPFVAGRTVRGDDEEEEEDYDICQ